jgi:selenium-binding protein 1
LLANWDKTGENDVQFLRGYDWDGNALTQTFEVDFYKEKLGRAHHIKLGSKALKSAYVDQPEQLSSSSR